MSFASVQFEIADGHRHPEQALPRLLYVWHWYLDMADYREAGFGIGPITYREMHAWSQLCKVDISASEVGALRSVDRAYRLYQYRKDHPEKQDPVSFLKEIASTRRTS